MLLSFCPPLRLSLSVSVYFFAWVRIIKILNVFLKALKRCIGCVFGFGYESSLLSEQIYTLVLMLTVYSCIKSSRFIWRQNLCCVLAVLFSLSNETRISNRLEFACATKIVENEGDDYGIPVLALPSRLNSFRVYSPGWQIFQGSGHSYTYISIKII